MAQRREGVGTGPFVAAEKPRSGRRLNRVRSPKLLIRLLNMDSIASLTESRFRNANPEQTPERRNSVLMDSTVANRAMHSSSLFESVYASGKLTKNQLCGTCLPCRPDAEQLTENQIFQALRYASRPIRRKKQLLQKTSTCLRCETSRYQRFASIRWDRRVGTGQELRNFQ